MMTSQAVAAFPALPAVCPGPVPTSAAHREHCRKCDKCSDLARLFDAARKSTDDAARIEISSPARLD
jgi:hypothetical protein